MGVQEIIHEVMTPANKLIDTVAAAVGRFTEPWHKVRMAKAAAKEIKLIGEALRENADIPINYEKGDVNADITDFDEFVKRTQARMAYQELAKQENIENVCQKAYEILEHEDTCSADPVDKDWINRFFNSVQDISDEDMQEIWAKILADEIIRPQRCSLRTLENLRNLSKNEAQLFQKILPYIICSGEEKFISSDNDVLEIIGITFPDIMLLCDCGLFSSQNLVTLTSTINETEPELFYSKDYCMFLNAKHPSVSIELGIFSLSRSGDELYEILTSHEVNEELYCKSIEAIFKNHLNNIEISIHNVIRKNANNVEYKIDPIKTISKHENDNNDKL